MDSNVETSMAGYQEEEEEEEDEEEEDEAVRRLRRNQPARETTNDTNILTLRAGWKIRGKTLARGKEYAN